MSKTLKIITVALALAVVTAGAGGVVMAGPHDNPYGVLYPDTFWGTHPWRKHRSPAASRTYATPRGFPLAS